MGTRNLLPVSWNGTSINTAQYASWFEDARPGPHNMPRSVVSIEAGRTGKAPGAVRTQPQAETWELTIKLTATDETDVQAMNAIFVEGVQVYLRCTDGAASPVTWRISCHALRAPQLLKGTKSTFILPIRVADPTWEEDTVNTDTQSNKTASPITLGPAGVVANNGTRDCEPILTLTADVAKSELSFLDDFPYVLRGFWVNRAPNELVDEPVYLFDSAGVAGRLATNTGTSGPKVLRTDRTNQINNVGGITATQLTIPVDTAVGGGIPATGGLVMIDSEQIRCISNSGTLLTVDTDGRGVGGTTAATHADNAVITYSTTLVNGDDCRVWFDNSPNYERYLVAWNSAASDVVVVVNAGKGISLTPAKALTATWPAVGDTLNFVEGNEQMDDAGYFVDENEVFHWSAKSGENGVVIDGRGLRGTTAAAHVLPTALSISSITRAGTTATVTTASAHGLATGQRVIIAGVTGPLAADAPLYNGVYVITVTGGTTFTYVMDGTPSNSATGTMTETPETKCWLNPHFYEVGFGWARADAPPSALANRPCIQLPGSSNRVQKWGDQADDALTRYYDVNYPNRPKHWDLGFDKDGNDVSPLMSIPDSSTILQFKDDVPGDGSQPRNYAEIPVPQGIRAGDANAIKNDWTPELDTLNLELFTRDAGDALKLQDQLMQAAPAAARALPAALAQTAYGVKLKGRYNIATGFYAGDHDQYQLPAASNSIDTGVAYRFTLSKPTRVTGYTFRAKLASAGSVTIRSEILSDSSNLPTLAASNGQILIGNVGSFTIASTSYAEFRQLYDGSNNGSPPVTLPAGTYWVVFWFLAGAIAVNIAGALSGWYTLGGESIARAALNRNRMADLRIESTYLQDGTANIEAEQPCVSLTGARLASTASFDKSIITLEPTQTVYVHRCTAPVTNGGTGALFHMKATPAASPSGKSHTIDKWMKPASTLAIDYAKKTCVYTEDAIAEPLLGLLGTTDPELTLQPGNNTVTVTDVSLLAPGQMDAQLDHRGARA